MAKTKQRQAAGKALPLWGHALLHGTALLFLAGLYWGSVLYGEYRTFLSTGILPVLLVAYAAFAGVALYNAILDRMDPDGGPAPPATNVSSEAAKKGDG